MNDRHEIIGEFLTVSKHDNKKAIIGTIISILAIIILMFIPALFPNVPVSLCSCLSSICGVNICFNAGKLKSKNKFYLKADECTLSFRCKHIRKTEMFISDISFTHYTSMSLTVKTKSGKRYQITRLTNAKDVYSFLQKRIDQVNTMRDPSVILDDIYKSKHFRNAGIVVLIFSFICMFASIFITVNGTNGKEISEFTAVEYRYFLSFAIVFCLIILGIFVIAHLIDKYSKDLADHQYEFHRAAMKSTEYRHNCIDMIYTSDYSFRIRKFYDLILEEYSYTVETFIKESTLATVFESKIFDTIEEMNEDIDENFSFITDFSNE